MMIILLLCLVVVSFIIYWYLAKPPNLPPGPSGLPILGYLPWIFYYGSNRIYFIEQLRQKYGDIFCLRVGFSYMLFLNSMEVIKEAFKNQEHFAGRGLKLIQDELTKGKGILSNEGVHQKEHRRFILRSLRNLGFGKTSFEEPIIETINSFCEAVENHNKERNGGGMDMHTAVISSVADNITRIVLGTKFNKEEIEFMVERLEILQTIPPVFFLINSFPFLSFAMKIPFFKKLVGVEKFKNLRKPLEERIMKYVENHKSTFDKNNISDFMYSYIDEQSRHMESSEEKNSWDDEQILHACTDLIAAGIGATDTSITSGLLIMAADQKWQGKLHEEIEKVIGLERPPSMKDVTNMPLCDATILEILRYSSIVLTGIPHAATENCSLNGYFIPKGTAVFANLYNVSRNKSVFKDPDNFNPAANFLNDDQTQIINRDKSIPFGIGRRSCIGESLARMEVTLFLIGILQRYKISLDPKYGKMTFIDKLFRFPSHRVAVFTKKN